MGCAHKNASQPLDRFVQLECIVEEYSPDALVFHDLDGLPYDARSRVSRVRVVAPKSLAGHCYSIDLLSSDDKDARGFEDFHQPGALVRFGMPFSLTSDSDKQLIPVYVLRRALVGVRSQVAPPPSP